MLRPKFDLDKYTSKYHAMLIRNKEDLEFFLRYLHSKGRTWHGGSPYVTDDTIDLSIFGVSYGYVFSEKNEDILILFNEGTTYNLCLYEDNELDLDPDETENLSSEDRFPIYEILCFSAFEWEE